MKYLFLFIALVILTSCHKKRDYYNQKFSEYCDCAFAASMSILPIEDPVNEYFDHKYDSCHRMAGLYLDSLNQVK